MDFTLASGYVITIDDNGLSAVKRDGAAVSMTTEPTRLIDGTWFYESWSSRSYLPNLSAKSHAVNGNVVTVNHTYTGVLNANAVYAYTASGDDLLVSVAVTNLAPAPIKIPAFRTTGFLFSGTPVPSQQDVTTQSYPYQYYPSYWRPLGGYYLTGNSVAGPSINVCIWQIGDHTRKFMTQRTGTGYQTGGQSLVAFWFDEIPPQGSGRFGFGLRFSATNDNKNLLASYKTALRSQFPSISYSLDARPVVTFSAIGTTYVRPDNPYGYNDSNGTSLFRRFDKPGGAQYYVDQIAPNMVAGKFQGILMWQPQGVHPRGVQYRPDFKNWPPETVPAIPILTGGFKALGLKVGLLARPGTMVTPTGWSTDGTYPAGNDYEQAPFTTGLFKWGIANGFDLGYYLDRFINDTTDHDILKTVRAALGTVPTFSEFATALSCAYSSIYLELYYDAATRKYKFPALYSDLLYLWPEAVRLTKYRSSEPSAGEASRLEFMFQNRLTPTYEDYLLRSPSKANLIRPFVDQYLDTDGNWK